MDRKPAYTFRLILERNLHGAAALVLSQHLYTKLLAATAEARRNASNSGASAFTGDMD